VNIWVLLGGAIVVLPLLALLAQSFGRDPHAVPSVLEAGPAPAFSLVDLDGATWTLESLRGQPVVVNFWSTWCAPCKMEHPILQRAKLEWPEVTFLGVIYADDVNKARAYLDATGTTYPHLLDPGGHTAIDYGVAGVPETFFIAPNGTIALKYSGPVSVSLLTGVLEPMLRRP
jgi:cytochrome c biogenesis protein CcmG/thiol:disulfide interchange protein DsbE